MKLNCNPSVQLLRLQRTHHHGKIPQQHTLMTWRRTLKSFFVALLKVQLGRQELGLEFSLD